ncbi:hypothetical protein MMC21_001200 [Puttea exsequens]|nr:hypothetical protein [Puttea exsequens]
MPILHPLIPPAPEPKRKTFDPWNSSSTGHQRADNRLAGSTSWRLSRTLKLGHQFNAGEGGGQRTFDTVGAGSKEFGRDGRKENGKWKSGAPGLREKGWRDVGMMLTEGSQAEREKQETNRRKRDGEYPETVEIVSRQEEELDGERNEKAIFANLTIYINGSTHPLISDHKLKHLLAANGANISIALGRRTVTHAILGRPNGQAGGVGGGLAGSKIQKEIQRVRGKGVKFVGVEWVLESLKAGKRLAEARFEVGGLRPVGMKSVYGMFGKEEKCLKDEARDEKKI